MVAGSAADDRGAIAARLAGFERVPITPVVVWGGPVGTLTKQAAEVARIHVIPLADFDRPPELLRIPEGRRWSCSWRCWAATCTRRPPPSSTSSASWPFVA